MKTLTHEIQTGQSSTIIHHVQFGLLLGLVLAPITMAFGADDSFQHDALFNPSKSLLKAEARGRIMIYDGLEHKVVEQALDEQFERIEHMMFVGTQHTQPDGEIDVEDDGC